MTKGKAASPFRRTEDRNRQNTKDAKGNVRVLVQLSGPSGRGTVKGNINRSMTVAVSRVSEVAAYIEKALFGEAE